MSADANCLKSIPLAKLLAGGCTVRKSPDGEYPSMQLWSSDGWWLASIGERTYPGPNARFKEAGYPGIAETICCALNMLVDARMQEETLAALRRSNTELVEALKTLVANDFGCTSDEKEDIKTLISRASAGLHPAVLQPGGLPDDYDEVDAAHWDGMGAA